MNDVAVSIDNPLLAALNPEQRQAVEATGGPLLVLAGAGTGKTRVLTTRIACILMNKLAWPDEILAVTFTNKAAREMAERIDLLLTSPSPVRGEGWGGGNISARQNTPSLTLPPAGGGNSLRWMGTFHSIGARVIRRHAEKLGLTSSFTILDVDDQLRLLKAILAELHIDEKSLPPKLFSAVIQSWKDQGLTPDNITSAQDLQAAGGQAARVYKAYQERLRSLNAADFGDLILHMLTLFTRHPGVLEEYAKRFKYILVDEYQDTNVAQYLWLRLLASFHKNICCVGDDDQSIYSWRGAEVGNILRFERDYPNARTVRLERNYRSTPHILAAASAVIANNRGRLGKTLWTHVKDGEKIRLKSVWDEREEARFIGEEVEDMQKKGIPLGGMAILVRAGFQTRAFEERFLTLGVPYRVIGGLRFYERAEIRDAVAYLRIIASPADGLAFERVINIPRRGIGQATMQQLHTVARNLNASLYNATMHLLKTGEIKGKLASSLQRFIDSCERWRKKLDELTLPEIVDLVLEESGYRAMWQQEKTPEAAGKLENLKELSRAVGEFENINNFLEHVSLVTEAANADSNADMVSLMTLHAAKGLEFDAVFLPGWEEGLFPHQRAIDESGARGLEEERRLAYVGMTRARKKLTIAHAANRRIYNQWQSSVPSRFIAEIPQEHIETLDGGVYGSAQSGGNGNWKDEVAAILGGAPKKEESHFARGARVFHQKFGYGRIESSSGGHLDIAFEKAGHKKVLADFVKPA
ncbi:MAG: UvrD-helicase domain-containing protein [Pseudomonadota bacterium]|nr:UvrD-helicase domain-containing protein [Pseudomonadota bacterium]MDE3036917.1 UvrD-helicase domain-containing protein [Pseudomonadota bacterium]